jgi:hypothetical protein
MRESCINIETTKSVQECARTFREAADESYTGGRKFLAGLNKVVGTALGQPTIGGLEYFTPPPTPFESVDGGPAWQAGVLIPGYNKVRGANKMGVHIYVVDHGDKREVQLVGPYGLGDKGSTDRLLQSIASHFSD